MHLISSKSFFFKKKPNLLLILSKLLDSSKSCCTERFLWTDMKQEVCSPCIYVIQTCLDRLTCLWGSWSLAGDGTSTSHKLCVLLLLPLHLEEEPGKELACCFQQNCGPCAALPWQLFRCPECWFFLSSSLVPFYMSPCSGNQSVTQRLFGKGRTTWVDFSSTYPRL